MMKQADYYEDVTDEGRIIRLTGNLSLACLGELPDRLTALPDDVAALDLSGVEHIDTIGAWLIHRTARDRDVRISGANADAKRLIEVAGTAGQTVAVRRPYGTPFRRVLGESGAANLPAGAQLGGLCGLHALPLSFARHGRS